MFDLLSKEKIYGIDAVSSCFVIDIEIRDFINSVRAEIFDCVEFDIAFKVFAASLYGKSAKLSKVENSAESEICRYSFLG